MTTQSLITEFMNTTDDVWTVRFTPPDTQGAAEVGFHCSLFEKGVADLLKQEKIYRYILAKEKTKSGKVHYHLRFTTLKSESVVRKYFRDYLVSPDLSGQKYCVFHPCQVNGKMKDDKLWKSATYVCKDGDIVSSYGYTTSEIQDLIAYGNSLKKSGNDPLWTRVISRSRLQDGATDEEILNAMEEFYKSLDKPLPQWTHIKTALHNIKYTLQTEYRFSSHENILNKMRNMSELFSNY